jgi:hypothetical protein
MRGPPFCAQNYTITGSTVSRYITRTTSGSGGYTCSPGGGGGKVTAQSSASGGQNASTTITVEFAVTVQDNVLPDTPQGWVKSHDHATGSVSASNGGAYATSGYTYASWDNRPYQE